MIKLTDIPSFTDWWVIRGTREVPRLYNPNKNKVIKLSPNTLRLMLMCDGLHDVGEICDELHISLSSVYSFIEQFYSEGVLKDQGMKQKKEIDISMGPREPWLKEVHLDITDTCNLRCRHCFWGENLKNSENSSFEEWENLIHSLKNCGTGRIVISGGEAFTNPDLIKIICCAKNEGVMVASLFTNGTILDQHAYDIVSFLTENNLETAFYISLDGKCKGEHDFIRGKGSFEKTIAFIEYLIEYKKKNNAKYKVLINSLIYKNNCHNLVEWYRFLEDIGVDGWRFTTGRLSGNMIRNEEIIKINSRDCFSEYIKLIEFILEKYDSGEDIIFLNIENFFTTRQLFTKKVYIFDESLNICDYKRHACSVDPKGNVQFCTGWQNVKYGNAFKEGMEKIWYSDKLQRMKEFKISEITGCTDCKYLKYCGGGCRLECKDMVSKDEAICDNYILYEEYLLPMMESRGMEFVVE